MKIIVQEIDKIEAVTKPFDFPVLRITAHLTDGQAHDLFIELWENYGDEGIRRWLVGEPYEFVKLDDDAHGGPDTDFNGDEPAKR